MITKAERKQLTDLISRTQQILQDINRGLDDPDDEYSASIAYLELYLDGLEVRPVVNGKRVTAYDMFKLVPLMNDLYEAGIRDASSNIPLLERHIPEYDKLYDALREYMVDPEHLYEEEINDKTSI